MSALQVVLGLMVAVTALALLARMVRIPYPILLVLGGLAIALVPGLPRVSLAPDVVFLVFLPPLVFAAGWFTSLRDVKANLRAIGLLSIGLVLATVVVVAVVAHALVPGLTWAAAFVVGAIVSPTDTVAPSAVFQRLGAPRRLVTILEGESLVNDATGLIAYKFAVVAVVTGAFSPWQAGLQFVLSSLGGVALGLAIMWLLNQLMRRVGEAPIEITLSFLAPYAVYLAAQQLGLSGVLAVAAAGIYASRRDPQTFSAGTRVAAYAVWEVTLFVLNGLVFVLIGLQLPVALDQVAGRSAAQLVGYGLAVSAAAILLRLLWVFPGAYVPRFLSARIRARESDPGWRNVLVVAWTGMRGAVSLAAALALPLTVNGGAPFPDRGLILLVTFCVILATLVGQGLTLPPLMRWLGVGSDEAGVAEEVEARTRAIEAALARLDELEVEGQVPTDGIRFVRAHYGKRQKQVQALLGRVDHEHGPGDGLHHDHEPGSDHVEDHRSRMAAVKRLQLEGIAAERAVIVQLRNTGVIGDDALMQVQRELDLEELRLAQA